VECLFVDLVEMSNLFLIGDISLLVSLQIVCGLVERVKRVSNRLDGLRRVV
jgi:hypothetical protein